MKNGSNRKVVITGMGVVSPIGIGHKRFWESLAAGRHGMGRITAFDPHDIPCKIAAEVKDFDILTYADKKKARRWDRFVQFGVGAAAMAIEDARLTPGSFDPQMAGVVIGSGMGGLDNFEKNIRSLSLEGYRGLAVRSVSMVISSSAATDVAIQNGFNAFTYSVAAACATSAISIGLAMRHIQNGDADIILAGGAEAPIQPSGIGGFSRCQALTSEYNDQPGKSCRPFDAKRSGFVMGEGSGVVVLESEEHALKRGAKIYAELAGFGQSSDAYHETAPLPDASQSTRSILSALRDAGLQLEDIQYINAHGTGTVLNDALETMAIKLAFGKRAPEIPISSTKSMTGHSLGATAAIELIATVLALTHNMIPPTINLDNPDSACDLDYVPNTARACNINAAISNSFGFGGHNAVLAIKRFQA